MESERFSINLDQPLFDQQAVKNLLNFSHEQKAKSIELEKFLEIAKLAVRQELVNCGCSERKLTGIKLECHFPPYEGEEFGEVYTYEWSQSTKGPEAVDDVTEASQQITKGSVTSDTFPTSEEFLSKLTESLDKAITSSLGATVNTVMMARLDNHEASITRVKCDLFEGILYKRQFLLDGTPRDWVRDELGQMIPCPKNRIPVSPRPSRDRE